MEADPEQRSERRAQTRTGAAHRPRRGRGLVIPVDRPSGPAIPDPDVGRFTRPTGRIGRLSASAHVQLRPADVRAGALLRRLAATRYGALVALAAVAAVLLALSWLGLALRDASAGRHAAERARSAAAAALRRDQARIDALSAQLGRAALNARHLSRRARRPPRPGGPRLTAERKLALDHRRRH